MTSAAVASRLGRGRDLPAGWGELLNGVLNFGALAIGLALSILVVLALIRGDLVPGYVYKRELERGNAAEARLDAARAKDEAAATAAEIAERAAAAVIHFQSAGRRATNEPDEPV